PLRAKAGHDGRGGGGQRSPTPATKGRLPQAAKNQFVPPIVRPVDTTPKLVIAPTIVTTADLHLPTLPLPLGDPNGIPGPPSGGLWSGGGIGNTHGTGVGSRSGPGYGDGDTDGVATVQNARVTSPV